MISADVVSRTDKDHVRTPVATTKEAGTPKIETKISYSAIAPRRTGYHFSFGHALSH
jgi:hypothetical protein